MEQRQHCASLASDLAEKSALPHDLWRIAPKKKTLEADFDFVKIGL
jgi:hypothetical protein